MTKNYAREWIVVLLVASLLSSPIAFADEREKSADEGFFETSQESSQVDLQSTASGVYGWGLADSGALGEGSASVHRMATYVRGPSGLGQLFDVVQVSSGDTHTLALKENGTVWAWGNGFNGRLGDGNAVSSPLPVQVVGEAGQGLLEDVVQVGAGSTHSAALKSNGTVWTWGSNGAGRLGDGTTTDRDTPGPVVGPDGEGILKDIVEIAVGQFHNFAIKSDGTVWAWGSNGNGRLGDGTSTSRSTPVQVVGPEEAGVLEGVVHIAAGERHSLAVLENGTAWAWGSSFNGRLGTGMINGPVPAQVLGPGGEGHLQDVVQIEGGEAHSVALKSDGTVWSWGWNANGRLGDNTTTERTTPVQVVGPQGAGHLENVTRIDLWSRHTTALQDDGSVWAWGNNNQARLGDGTTTERHFPVPVLAPRYDGHLSEAVQATTGERQGFAVLQDGTLVGWGENQGGRIGTGPLRTLVPERAAGVSGKGFLDDVIQISSDGGSVALMANGTAWWWGNHQVLPTPVRGPDGTGMLEDVVQVSAGFSSHMALLSNGTVWEWVIGSETPVQVKGPGGVGHLENVIQISSGTGHRLAVKDNGTVWAWGSNNWGRLGDGTQTNRDHPVQVVGFEGEGFLQDVVQVSAGSSHSLARKSDGTVWAWGANNVGQLGISDSNGFSWTPVWVRQGCCSAISDAVEVTAGNQRSFAVRAGGGALSWGSGMNFALGSGSTTNRDAAFGVQGISDVASIEAGRLHTLALKNDGTVWGWGGNSGRIGDGTTTTRSFPTQTLAPGGSSPFQQVQAISAGGSSSFAIASATTPGPPQSPGATAGPGVGQITLSWAAPGDTGGHDISSYVVYEERGSGDVEWIAEVGPDEAWTRSGLGMNTSSTYRITAMTVEGEGGTSQTASATTFDLPATPLESMATTGPGPGEITVSWQPPMDDGGGPILAYRVYDVSSQESPLLLGEAPASNPEFVHSGLGHGETRSYRVSAVNAAGEGPMAMTLTSTTLPADDPPPMPEGRSATSAAYEGDFAYVFGGRSEDGNATDSIIRYDVDANEVTMLDSDLPSPRLGTSAVWSGNVGAGDLGAECHPNCFDSKMFIFGGLDTHEGDTQMETACHPNCMSVGKEILEFDPVDESVTVRGAEFDAALYGTSAVWDPVDEVSYVFGGFSEDDGSGGHALGALCHPNCMAGKSIRVYDPGTDSVDTHDAHLPVALGGTSAVWDDAEQVAYIFGGFNENGDEAGAQCHPNCMRGILRFDPNAQAQSQSVDPMPVELPSDRWNTSAVFDGRYAYVIGGEDRTGPIDEIVRFDPVEMEVAVVGSLPTSRTQTSAITDGTDAFIFGGLEQGNVTTDEIVQFSPSSPQSLSTQAGAGAGEIELSWSPPIDDGGEPIVAYRVYRSDEEDAPHELIETLPVDLAASDDQRLTFTDSGLDLLDTQYYRVSAVNGVGEGPSTKQTVGRTYDPFNIYLTPDGASLQQAADLLAANGTIHLAGGSYQGNVLLDVPATLQPGVNAETGTQVAHEGPPVIVGGIETTAALQLLNLTLEEGANGHPVLRTIGPESIRVQHVMFEGTGLSQTESLVELGYSSTGDVDIQFEQNTVVNATGTGLRITGDNPTARLSVLENHFQGNHDAAVVDGARYGSLWFDRNLVEGQSGTGLRFHGAVEGETVLRTNQFQGNTLAVAVTDDTTHVDARYNWWGHAAGPALGDPVEMPLVDHTPWCLQEDCSLGGEIETLGLP